MKCNAITVGGSGQQLVWCFVLDHLNVIALLAPRYKISWERDVYDNPCSTAHFNLNEILAQGCKLTTVNKLLDASDSRTRHPPGYVELVRGLFWIEHACSGAVCCDCCGSNQAMDSQTHQGWFHNDLATSKTTRAGQVLYSFEVEHMFADPFRRIEHCTAWFHASCVTDATSDNDPRFSIVYFAEAYQMMHNWCGRIAESAFWGVWTTIYRGEQILNKHAVCSKRHTSHEIKNCLFPARTLKPKRLWALNTCHILMAYPRTPCLPPIRHFATSCSTQAKRT